jgi:hypothetical protein
MNTYIFEAEDGTIIEREMTRLAFVDLPLDPAKKRVYLDHAGKRYWRQKPTLVVGPPMIGYVDHEFESFTLPDGWGPRGPHGGVMVNGRRHAREIKAESKDKGQQVYEMI